MIPFVIGSDSEWRTPLNKYAPLTGFLERQIHDRIELLFDDIEDEDKIGVPLPRAAKEYPEWWANEVNPKTRHYQCRAWTEAGWKVEGVDIEKETVIFARVQK
jgi:hypothetical protein